MRSHQIVQHNPHFRLQQYILKKQFYFEAGKGKEAFISLIVLLNLVPSFNKYSRNEITTRYQQCRRQTKQSEWALAENGGHYKMD